MPLLTKIDIANLASRVRGHRRQMMRHSEQLDLLTAAAALEALADLVSVGWPIAVQDQEDNRQ